MGRGCASCTTLAVTPPGFDAGARVRNTEKGKVCYFLETEKGSSGAPVFRARGSAHLLAVHRRGIKGDANYGTAVADIIDWLGRERGGEAGEG